jgi:replicative DNA helicase
VSGATSRVPPHDLDAEAAVLESVMVRGGSVYDVAETLAPEDFYSDANRAIYEAALALANASQPTDVLAVASWLRERDRLRAVGGAEYLSTILNETPAHYDVEACARAVASRARLRRMIAVGHRVTAEGYGDVGDTQEWLEGVERDVFAIAQTTSSSQALLVHEVLQAAFTKIRDAAERGDQITGLPTGLTKLDGQLGGLQKGDLTILAARPGMGKTALALGLALAVAESEVWSGKARRRQASAIFSLEMPREQLGTRMIYSEAGVNSAKLRRGAQFSQDEWGAITESASAIAKLPLWIDDTPAITPMALRAKTRRLRSQAEKLGVELGLVVVDYLQLMDGKALRGKNGSRENEITEISKSLKAIAKECGVHMLALSQLNRDVEKRADKRPQLSDLRESGSIEQDADNVVFIHREAYYKPDDEEAKGKAELIIAKQRNGPTGRAMVAFRDDCVRFENLAQEWQQ